MRAARGHRTHDSVDGSPIFVRILGPVPGHLYDRMELSSRLPPMQTLLVSTYELGHQPLGLASPAAWLRRAGINVRCVDLAKERLGDDAIRAAELIAFHLPMHTATRLAAPVIRRARALNPHACLCAYGLYAPLNG